MEIITTYLKDKLTQLNTYITTFIIGSLINIYGQLLVPWLHGYTNPFNNFANEFDAHPWLVTLSILLGYIFPFCVSTLTAILTRYQNRVFESQALFPALKPDPVFRASEDGKIVAAGAKTQELLNEHNFVNAKQLLGEETWQRVINQDKNEIEVYVPSIASCFIVVYAHTEDNHINVHMTKRKKVD